MLLKRLRLNIKVLRRLTGITSNELSKKLFLKPKRISDIEDGRGKITLEEIDKISIYFNVTISDILHNKLSLAIYVNPF